MRYLLILNNEQQFKDVAISHHRAPEGGNLRPAGIFTWGANNLIITPKQTAPDPIPEPLPVILQKLKAEREAA